MFILFYYRRRSSDHKSVINELEGEDSQCIKEDESEKDSDETTCSGSEDSASNSNTESVPHTVVFKCIGAVRDTDSQTTLRTARDRLASGWTVPVRMRPEPTNIRDLRA